MYERPTERGRPALGRGRAPVSAAEAAREHRGDTAALSSRRAFHPLPLLCRGLRFVCRRVVRPSGGRGLEDVPELRALRVRAPRLCRTALLEGCSRNIPTVRLPPAVLVLSLTAPRV